MTHNSLDFLSTSCWALKKTVQCLLFVTLELGDGWFPAVMENENEFNFIREAQKFVTDSKSYWIGGSSDFLGPIKYYQYVPNEEGLYMKQL